MPPEIVRTQQHNYKIDIWSLGILLYEMIHGSPPFQAETFDKIEEEFENKIIKVDDSVSSEIKDLIMKLLNYSVDNRISLEEVLRHPAIVSRKKDIEREITQEEFRLLRKYYYMNSGGNQLTTHDSLYARDLKKESMLVRESILQEIEQGSDDVFINPNLRSFKKKSTFDQRREMSQSGSVSSKEKYMNFFPNMFEPEYLNIDNSSDESNIVMDSIEQNDMIFFKNKPELTEEKTYNLVDDQKHESISTFKNPVFQQPVNNYPLSTQNTYYGSPRYQNETSKNEISYQKSEFTYQNNTNSIQKDQVKNVYLEEKQSNSIYNNNNNNFEPKKIDSGYNQHNGIEKIQLEPVCYQNNQDINNAETNHQYFNNDMKIDHVNENYNNKINSNDGYQNYNEVNNLTINYQNYDEEQKTPLSYPTYQKIKQPSLVYEEYQKDSNYQTNQENPEPTMNYYTMNETKNNSYSQPQSPKNKYFSQEPPQKLSLAYQKTSDIKNLEEEIKNIVIDIDPQTNNYSSRSNLNKNLYHQANKITTTITRKILYNDSNNEQTPQNQPMIEQLPSPEPNNTEQIENTSEEDKESPQEPEEKKTPQRKYKVTTVPLEKSRVKVNHEKKLSNIGPITVIQQGTFSLLSAYERANISKITKRERSRSQKPNTRKSNKYLTHHSKKPKVEQEETEPRIRYRSELNIDLDQSKGKNMTMDNHPNSERVSKLENRRNKYTLEEYLNQIQLNDQSNNL